MVDPTAAAHETLDPADLEGLRALAHRMVDDAFLRRRLDGAAGLSAAVLGMSAVVAGDLERANRWSLEAHERMYASTPRAAAYCYYPLASIALAEGDFAGTERWASEGIEHAQRVGHDAVLPDLRRSLAYALFRLERYAEEVNVLVEALEEADRGGNVAYGTPLRATMGRTLVRLGRSSDAVPLLLRALRDACACRRGGGRLRLRHRWSDGGPDLLLRAPFQLVQPHDLDHVRSSQHAGMMAALARGGSIFNRPRWVILRPAATSGRHRPTSEGA